MTTEQIALMERESANLEQEFKAAEQSYGTDHLHLVLAKGYLSKLLANAKVVRYRFIRVPPINRSLSTCAPWRLVALVVSADAAVPARLPLGAVLATGVMASDEFGQRLDRTA